MDLLYQIVVDVNLKPVLQSEALLFSVPAIQQYLFLGLIISPTSVAIGHIHSSLDCIVKLTVRESVSFSLRRFFFPPMVTIIGLLAQALNPIAFYYSSQFQHN